MCDLPHFSATELALVSLPAVFANAGAVPAHSTVHTSRRRCGGGGTRKSCTAWISYCSRTLVYALASTGTATVGAPSRSSQVEEQTQEE